MIPIEDCYWGACIFCGKQTHYRIQRDYDVWHQVCKGCAESSRTIECAEERYAIIDESFQAEQRLGAEEFKRRSTRQR